MLCVILKRAWRLTQAKSHIARHRILFRFLSMSLYASIQDRDIDPMCSIGGMKDLLLITSIALVFTVSGYVVVKEEIRYTIVSHHAKTRALIIQRRMIFHRGQDVFFCKELRLMDSSDRARRGYDEILGIRSERKKIVL